jgi:hypothetical protein
VLGGGLTSYDRERFDHFLLTQTMSGLDVKCKDATVVGDRERVRFRSTEKPEYLM